MLPKSLKQSEENFWGCLPQNTPTSSHPQPTLPRMRGPPSLEDQTPVSLPLCPLTQPLNSTCPNPWPYGPAQQPPPFQ